MRLLWRSIDDCKNAFCMGGIPKHTLYADSILYSISRPLHSNEHVQGSIGGASVLADALKVTQASRYVVEFESVDAAHNVLHATCWYDLCSDTMGSRLLTWSEQQQNLVIDNAKGDHATYVKAPRMWSDLSV